MSTAIRLATPEDAAAIVALYAPYVQNTSVTFEYEVPSVAEYRARIEEITRFFPFYILEEDGVPAGYAYAHFFHPRKAYQWVCETTIYVGEGFHRKGYATRLLMHLFRLLAAEYERIYVGTCEDLLPFYEKLGFEYAYTAPHFFRDNYPGVTFAEGALDDMTYLVRPLR